MESQVPNNKAEETFDTNVNISIAPADQTDNDVCDAAPDEMLQELLDFSLDLGPSSEFAGTEAGLIMARFSCQGESGGLPMSLPEIVSIGQGDTFLKVLDNLHESMDRCLLLIESCHSTYRRLPFMERHMFEIRDPYITGQLVSTIELAYGVARIMSMEGKVDTDLLTLALTFLYPPQVRPVLVSSLLEVINLGIQAEHEVRHLLARPFDPSELIEGRIGEGGWGSCGPHRMPEDSPVFPYFISDSIEHHASKALESGIVAKASTIEDLPASDNWSGYAYRAGEDVPITFYRAVDQRIVNLITGSNLWPEIKWTHRYASFMSETIDVIARLQGMGANLGEILPRLEGEYTVTVGDDGSVPLGGFDNLFNDTNDTKLFSDAPRLFAHERACCDIALWLYPERYYLAMVDSMAEAALHPGADKEIIESFWNDAAYASGVGVSNGKLIAGEHLQSLGIVGGARVRLVGAGNHIEITERGPKSTK